MGKVIWITGLSASGKTTLANELVCKLKVSNENVLLLDGDELRTIFNTTQNCNFYQRADRLALALQYSRLCQMLSDQGMTVVIATISLFKEVHQWNRENLPNYFEIYLKVPMEELKSRDPKGIYKRFELGEISHVAGLDIEIDEPESPDYEIDFLTRKSKESDIFEIITLINN